MNTVKNEERATYDVVTKAVAADDEIIRQALNILAARLHREAISLTSPENVRSYLRLSLAALEHEMFSVLFLDTQHRLIAIEEMFRGTLTQASVYPREVVKQALHHNAAAVIFAHNHPSGSSDPSNADIRLTDTLKQALSLVDVKALDHFVVGNKECVSLAERGLI